MSSGISVGNVREWLGTLVLVGGVIYGVVALNSATSQSVNAVEKTTAVLTVQIGGVGEAIKDLKDYVKLALRDHEERIRKLEDRRESAMQREAEPRR